MSQPLCSSGPLSVSMAHRCRTVSAIQYSLRRLEGIAAGGGPLLLSTLFEDDFVCQDIPGSAPFRLLHMRLSIIGRLRHPCGVSIHLLFCGMEGLYQPPSPRGRTMLNTSPQRRPTITDRGHETRTLKIAGQAPGLLVEVLRYDVTATSPPAKTPATSWPAFLCIRDNGYGLHQKPTAFTWTTNKALIKTVF